MPIVFDGPVLPADLTTFVREVPLPNVISLNRYLPDRLLNTNRVDVGQLTKTGRTARFRAYDGPLHRAQRDVAMLQTVHLPPLGDSLSMGELERLQLEFARTGGTNQQVFVDAIYNDGQTLTENVQRRMELARGDVLTDGKFTLVNEGGLTLEADYGVPEGNLVVPAGADWDNFADADPLLDLTTWVRYYRNDAGNGFSPGGMIISFDQLQNLLQNESIRKLAGTVLGIPNSVSQDAVAQVLQARGLPPIVEVYDSQVDVDGTPTRVTDAAKVIFVPPDPGTNLGYTAWGVSATALELVNDARGNTSFEDAPGIVGVVVKSDGPPFHQTTFVDAVGMPVLENPRALMVATVTGNDDSSSSS